MSESSANSSLANEKEDENTKESEDTTQKNNRMQMVVNTLKMNKASPSGKPGLWGTAAKLVQTPAAKETAVASDKRSLKSVAKRVNRQIKAKSLIKQWAKMTQHGQFAKNEEHLNYMRDIAEKSVTDLPEPVFAGMREEVAGILQDTLRQYRLELGTHRLTQEMQESLQKMKEEIASSSSKDVKRDQHNFFRKLSTVFVASNTNEKS